MNMRIALDVALSQYDMDVAAGEDRTARIDERAGQLLQQRLHNMNVLQFEEALSETCFNDNEFASVKQLMRTHGEDAAMATLGRMIWERVKGYYQPIEQERAAIQIEDEGN